MQIVAKIQSKWSSCLLQVKQYTILTKKQWDVVHKESKKCLIKKAFALTVTILANNVS